MSKNVVLAIAGMIVGWLIISFFTEGFDMQYVIGALFGFLLGYIVKREEKRREEKRRKTELHYCNWGV